MYTNQLMYTNFILRVKEHTFALIIIYYCKYNICLRNIQLYLNMIDNLKKNFYFLTLNQLYEYFYLSLVYKPI